MQASEHQLLASTQTSHHSKARTKRSVKGRREEKQRNRACLSETIWLVSQCLYKHGVKACFMAGTWWQDRSPWNREAEMDGSVSTGGPWFCILVKTLPTSPLPSAWHSRARNSLQWFIWVIFWAECLQSRSKGWEKIYRMHPSKSSKTYYGFVTLVALETLFYITSTFRLREKFNLLNV